MRDIISAPSYTIKTSLFNEKTNKASKSVNSPDYLYHEFSNIVCGTTSLACPFLLISSPMLSILETVLQLTMGTSHPKVHSLRISHEGKDFLLL